MDAIQDTFLSLQRYLGDGSLGWKAYNQGWGWQFTDYFWLGYSNSKYYSSARAYLVHETTVVHALYRNSTVMIGDNSAAVTAGFPIFDLEEEVTIGSLSVETNVTEGSNFYISTRRVPDTEDSHVFIVMTPKRHFSVSFYNIFLFITMILSFVPVLGLLAMKCYQFR